MKSVQTKGKSKQKNEKLRKVKLSAKSINSTISPDLSSLRKPIDTSVSDLYQVSKLLEDGTDEVKSILSYECDIIYECRTCRSLFRSIVNLISHKREYCRNKFDITLHRNILNNYNLHSAKESTIHMYKTTPTIIKDGIKNDRILRSQVSKETHKKDLSTVIDMLSKKRKKSMESNSLSKSENENAISNVPNNQCIYLESIDTNNSAVYQTVKSSDANQMVDNIDLMKNQITELQNMTDQHATALEGQISENQSEKSDSPIQLDMSDEETELLIRKPSMNNLACTICNAKFSTKKTLAVHVKTLHMSQRMCYPCPCCTSTFANTWSVYRHLYKVHRKSNEQVRKLRSQIQEKAFHRETTAMKVSENSRTTKTSVAESVTTKDSIKIQESINSVDSNAKLQNCGKRGQRLGRKTDLPARVQTPVTACNKTATKLKKSDKTLLDSTSNNMSYEIENIDAETNTIIKPSDKKSTSNINSEHISSSSEIYEDHETSIRVPNTSSLSKDWKKLENQRNCPSECNLLNNDLDIITLPRMRNSDNSKSLSSDENRDNFVSNKNLQSPEIVCTNANKTSSVLKIKNKKRKASSYHDEKQSIDLKEKDVIEVQEDNSKRQLSCSIQSNEMNPTSVMENKIASIANLQKLQCLLCKRKFTSMPNLRRHMAIHIGWNRYRCKLCDFKCFVKCDCVAHCNKMHNAQNNRTIIAEMVIEIPQNEYTYNEDIIMEVTNTVEKTGESDITDINVSCQAEIHVNVNNSSDSNITLQDKIIANEQTAELRTNDEHQNVDAENSNKTMMVQDMEEYMMNCGTGKLDAHPDLKRMIMEVILGSDDINTTKETNSEKPTSEIENDARGHVDTNDNDNENNIASIDKSREPSCSMSINMKHQRPTRNRIKPLSEDFIYDLKEVAFRKGCALFNDSGTLHVRKKTKLYD